MDLSKVDIIVGVDISASMQSKSTRNPGISRFKEVEELAFGIASQAAQFDSDGIDIITFGAGATIQTGVTPDRIPEIFKRGADQYRTDTHELVRLAAARQKETHKNTVCIVFTDGDATDRKATAQNIVNATKQMQADEELTFGFVQVGDDPNAGEFLRVLDDELKDMGAKFDIVDTITSDEASKMGVAELLAKFVAD
jgi:hypothetical protein